MYADVVWYISHTNVQGQIRLNGEVNVTQLDIPASNGYIHHIDGLLTPDSLLPLLPHRCDVISQRTVRVSGCVFLFQTRLV